MSKLSIIIPVYNEKNTIISVIDSIINLNLYGDYKKELIVVDDFSSDGTREILKDLEKKYESIKFLFNKKNYGKGFCIRKGLKIASGEYLITQDADLEYNVSDINKLLKEAVTNKLDVLYGSRNLGKNKRGQFLFYIGGIFLTKITNILYKQSLTDEATGYKLIKTELLKSLSIESNGFEFCPEVTAKVANLGYKIKEVPISYSARDKKDGKKIKYRDGIIAIKTLIKYIKK